jgi:hypothetical protein
MRAFQRAAAVRRAAGLFGGAVALAALSANPANAAGVNTITFSAASDYTNNFAPTLNGGSVAYNSGGQNLVYTAASAGGTSIIRYDTNPGDGQPGPADFLGETIKVDFTPDATSVANSSSMGVFTRVQSSGGSAGTGVLALLNAISTTSVQLRLFYGANASSTAAGTTFFNSTFNLATGTNTGGGTGSTNAIAAGSPLTFTLTETTAADPAFNLTVTDAQGLVASTGNVTLLSGQSDAYDGPGSVALRVNGVAVGDTIAIDNFAATPEPGTAGLVAIGGVAALARRRRRR